MSLSFNDARDHMLKPFKEVWDILGHPVVYTSVKPTEQASGGDAPSAPVWARVTIRHADGFQSSLTGPLEEVKRNTNIGTLHIQVFGELGDGSTAAYDAAGAIAKAYRKSRNNPVWFRRVRINEIGTKGPYDQINVLADFSYDQVE